jgi:hypothetical protein
MKLIVLLIATVLCALAVVSLAPAAHSTKTAAVCSDALEGARYYREWTWRWQDQLHAPRDRRDYRRGRLVLSCGRARHLAQVWQNRAVQVRRQTRYLNRYIRSAILSVFGPDEGPGAIVVARCETGDLLDQPRAALHVSNGQYTGIFQMSDQWEIQKYGRWRGRVRYGTVLDQVWAAYHMYRARTWQAWACRPDGTVAY